MNITQSELRELLDYDQESGFFYWKKTSCPRLEIGEVAGYITHGYVKITVGGVKYYAHQLAWLYVYGEWPKGDLDHIDMDRSHNWISNLRPATASQNAANAGLYNSNSSGIKGVAFAKRERKWKAYIRKDGNLIHLGYFARLEDAAAARHNAAIAMQGTFACEHQVPRA